MGFEEPAVVEPVDPFEGGQFEVVESSSWASVADQFGLVETDDRLGEGVIVGITHRSDRGVDAGLGELQRRPAE